MRPASRRLSSGTTCVATSGSSGASSWSTRALSAAPPPPPPSARAAEPPVRKFTILATFSTTRRSSSLRGGAIWRNNLQERISRWMEGWEVGGGGAQAGRHAVAAVAVAAVRSPAWHRFVCRTADWKRQQCGMAGGTTDRQPTNQPIDRPTNQPIDRPSNQATKQPTHTSSSCTSSHASNDNNNTRTAATAGAPVGSRDEHRQRRVLQAQHAQQRTQLHQRVGVGWGLMYIRVNWGKLGGVVLG